MPGRLFFLFWHHHAVFCICPSTRARTFPPMCTRKGCVNGMNKPDSSPRLSTTLDPAPLSGHRFNHLNPPTRPGAEVCETAAAHSWTGTPLSLAGWPGHAQPSPWVCECLVWYVRRSSGRHRKWARHCCAEKSHAKVREGAAEAQTKPLFFSWRLRENVNLY